MIEEPSTSLQQRRRKRLTRIDEPGKARFLTFSCYRRLPLFSNDHIKDLFVRRLSEHTEAGAIEMLAWVIMPEHVHLVLYPYGVNRLPAWLNAVKAPCARVVVDRWRALQAPVLQRIQVGNSYRFWQAGGGYDRVVWGSELEEKIRYCHRNPVTRGLTSAPNDYRWSSAMAYAGGERYQGPAIEFGLFTTSMRCLL